MKHPYIRNITYLVIWGESFVKMSTEVEVIQFGSVCFNNANFTIFVTPPSGDTANFRIPISQDQAQSECANFDDNFALGPIISVDEYNTVRTFLQEDDTLFPFDRTVEEHDIGFFVGLEALDGQEQGGGDTTVFNFVESSFNLNEEALDFYHTAAGEFPWSSETNEPNNVRGDQNCAHLLFFKDISFEIDGFLDDIECDSSTGFICRGLCETVIFEEDIDDNSDNPKEINNLALSGIIIFGLLILTSSLLFWKVFKEHREIERRQLALLYMNI